MYLPKKFFSLLINIGFFTVVLVGFANGMTRNTDNSNSTWRTALGNLKRALKATQEESTTQAYEFTAELNEKNGKKSTELFGLQMKITLSKEPFLNYLSTIKKIVISVSPENANLTEQIIDASVGKKGDLDPSTISIEHREDMSSEIIKAKIIIELKKGKEGYPSAKNKYKSNL